MPGGWKHVVPQPGVGDELDKVGVLHNARYTVHAERALVEFRVPVGEGGVLDVELRVVKRGTTSCGYEFRFVSDGGVVHAIGRRTIARTGPDRRPVPWSGEFRRIHERGVE